MKNVFIIGVLILFIFPEAKSQNDDYTQIKRNGAYVEFYLIRPDFTDGFFIINYEVAVGKKRKTNLRLGISPDFNSAVNFPITVTWITSPLKKHHFEYGLGVVLRVEHYVDPYGINSKEWFFDVPAGMIPLMYRYQKNKGIFIRAGLNIFISYPFLFSPAVSVGYKF